MSVRTKVLGLVDVLMRVPPIFVIDEVLKISMGINSLSGMETPEYNDVVKKNSTVVLEEGPRLENDGVDVQLNFTELITMRAYYSMDFFNFALCSLAILASIFTFILWTRHLVIVYMYIISIALIFLSYWSNVSAMVLIHDSPSILEDILSLNMNRLLDPGGVAFAIFPHVLAQWIMGMLFAYIHLGPRNIVIQKLLPFSFLMPLLLATLPLPNGVHEHSPAFAAILPLALSKIGLWKSSCEIVRAIYNGFDYIRSYGTNYGLSALVENEWQRLNVPCVLRAFWAIRLIEQMLTIIWTQENIPVLATVQTLMVNGCETLTAVLGMTSIVSIICHYIGKLFQIFLLADEYDDDRSIGTVSAILFYILALQTGLTTLQPEKRFIRLCRNFCLLLTAVLHFLHNIVTPVLMSLSAARNPSRKRHARALLMCLFLIVTPTCLLCILWSQHTPSTWLLAVTAFSIEVIVKVLVSLATYTLFLLDARRQVFWEKLDDYVYYIRAFGNSVEFFFGIFLFFNGAYILIFESGGAIRALMMCIHAYFNIWCEARAGWAVFMKRRTAVHKISALPEATEEQLRTFDDVCSICYQEMTSAKMTRCKHFFHGVCLRKWLYVQDRCPLCHEIIMLQDTKPANATQSQDVNAEDVAARNNNENQREGEQIRMPNIPNT